MKKLLILIITICCWSNVNAQSHDMSPGSTCKLIKTSVNSESRVCPACAAKDKKEKDAKLAEDNRRNQAIWDKAKADKIANENAWKAKQLEDAKNAHSGEVLINGNANVGVKNVSSSKISEINKLQKNYFYSIDKYENNSSLLGYFRPNNGFIVNGDTILKNHEFKSCHGIASVPLNNHPKINRYNFPPNIGIVTLNEEKISPPMDGRKVAVSVPISDLVDIKGKRILNDNNITAILHFADDYFILLKGYWYGWDNQFSFQEAEIYNYKTKEKYPLQKSNNGKTVDLSSRTNNCDIVYRVNEESLKPAESYKAFLVTRLDYKSQYVVYYINNDSKIERQEINY